MAPRTNKQQDRLLDSTNGYMVESHERRMHDLELAFSQTLMPALSKFEAKLDHINERTEEIKSEMYSLKEGLVRIERAANEDTIKDLERDGRVKALEKVEEDRETMAKERKDFKTAMKRWGLTTIGAILLTALAGWFGLSK